MFSTMLLSMLCVLLWMLVTTVAVFSVLAICTVGYVYLFILSVKLVITRMDKLFKKRN